MRAVGLYEFGGPDKLRVLDLPEPHAGAGQVRIRVHAAGVNPADTVLREGLRGQPDWDPPYLLGMDAAGVIDEIGSGTTGNHGIGDRVMVATAQGPSARGGGSYADYVVVDAVAVAPIPRDLDFPAAATLPMNGLTARDILDWLALPSGEAIAVTGSAGAVGGYVVQLAKAQGLQVIADAAERDEELVRSLGADRIVRRGDGIAERIRHLEADGVAAVVDAAVQNEAVLAAIRDGGLLATLRPWELAPPRGIQVRRARVDLRLNDGTALDTLSKQVDEGVLRPRTVHTLPPTEAAEAHRRLARGGLRERLILDFSQ